MVRRKSRKNPRRRARGARGPGGMMIDTFKTFVSPGSSTAINKSSLNVPTERPFRIHSVWVEMVAINGITTATGPYVSSCAVGAVDLYAFAASDLTGPLVASTGPFLVGPDPVRRRVRQPVSTDWVAADAAGGTQLVVIHNDCDLPSASGSQGTVLVIAKVHIQLGQETYPQACPTLRSGPIAVLPPNGGLVPSELKATGFSAFFGG